MESKFSRVKVNNEMELCRVSDMKVKEAVERALLGARISYFIKWEKGGIFSGNKNARHRKITLLTLYIIH